MKKVLMKMIIWMTLLGSIAIIISAFLPYAKAYDYVLGEWEVVHKLISVFKYEGNGSLKWALVAMGVAAVVSMIAVGAFMDSSDLKASITMIISAFVGKYFFAKSADELEVMMESEFLKTEKAIGSTLPEKAYVVLIIAAFLAFGFDIYNNYLSKYVKDMIVPMGELSCPKCGKTISKGSKFCGSCGFAMETLNCPKCGTKREMGEQFCKQCGERLSALETKEGGQNIQKYNLDGAKEVSAKHWVCGKCGEENAGSVMFCHKCGGGK